MALDDQTREAIDALLKDNRVVLFMKGTPAQPQCGFSAKTTAALNMLLPDYVTINVLDYPQVREGIKEYSNWPTIPQLYVEGELIGGCDIVLDMMQSGELADVLGLDKPDVAAPSIAISDTAAEAIRSAVSDQPNMKLHLKIDAGWGHSMNLDAVAAPDAISTESNGVTLYLDPWSAARANGLSIDIEEQLAGTSFVFDNPNAPPPVNQMTVQDLQQKLARGEEVLLFDVRTGEERARNRIEAARHWDQDAMQLIDSLPKDTQLVFHCEVGGRSQQAAEHYRRQGYSNLHNVQGGIRAWIEEIESAQAQD